MVAQPHFLLFCDTHYSDQQLGDARPGTAAGGGGGRWHFVLEQLDGPDRLEAADSELTVNRERLALLSVVRGLEALEQPSQVTLVTTSRYVSRGLRYGLNTWREADYMWERFGEQHPIRNSDLWRRVDTALQFHVVKCRLIQAGQTMVAAVADHSSTVPHATPGLAEPQSLTLPQRAVPQRSGRLAAAGGLSASASDPLPAQLLVAPPAAAAAAAAARQPWPQRPAYHRPRQPQFKGTAKWWSLAAAWIRWRRGRLHAKPSFYAT